MSVTGLPGQGPVRVGVAISDVTAGLYLAFGIMVALHERATSGEGQWVTTSLLEAMIGMLDFQAARFLVEGEVPGQEGNHHPTLAPMGVFPTADGHINIAASSGAQFRALLEALGATELGRRPEYADTRLRSRNRESLNAAIGELTRRRPSAEWIEELNARGIPCGPINRIDQAMQDPQVVHLGIATPVDHPQLGRISLVGQPIHLHRTPQRMRAPTPERGAHTEEVLRELGYDDEAVETLRRQGAV
jgi:formyl-CoA transferase